MKPKRDSLSVVILEAIRGDGRSLYAIARDAGIYYSALARFVNGERPRIVIGTVAKLADVLGLALVKRR